MEFGWWRKPKLFREKIFNENYNITDKKSTEIFDILIPSNPG